MNQRERDFWRRMAACVALGKNPGRAARQHLKSFGRRRRTWGPNAW